MTDEQIQRAQSMLATGRECVLNFLSMTNSVCAGLCEATIKSVGSGYQYRDEKTYEWKAFDDVPTRYWVSIEFAR